jgi:uncharacterized protein
MIRLSEIKLPLTDLIYEDHSHSDDDENLNAHQIPKHQPVRQLLAVAIKRLSLNEEDIDNLNVFKRSFDARGKDVVAVFIIDVVLKNSALVASVLEKYAHDKNITKTPDMRYEVPYHFELNDQPRPVVIGFGPCGMFAALLLAEMGARPIVLERGPNVRERTQKTWDLWRRQVLHLEGNVQFGEGGAGTFSDGKLYSQIKDPRFLGRYVLKVLAEHGAPIDILTEAHPHIGTFKLVKIVQSMRERIQNFGGEIRFGHKVIDVALSGDSSETLQLKALVVENLSTAERYTMDCTHAVLALGHSARDTFTMLFDRGINMRAKPFSIGFRIEHLQSKINAVRWGKHADNPLLGAADYKLVHHASNGRSVYSFCMCPGGTVVAATSEANRVVTNGMSQYSRSACNANSGLVVGVEPSDCPLDKNIFIEAFSLEQGAKYYDQAIKMKADGQVHPLAGIGWQRALESQAYILGGSNYFAPIQLIGDFLAKKASSAIGSVQPSYQPGIKLTDLSAILPDYAISALREAIVVFGKKIRGYDCVDAVITAVETRTSSPLHIPRSKDFQCMNVLGLYPAGEGAGYSGGILSAAVDGIKVAEHVAQNMAEYIFEKDCL